MVGQLPSLGAPRGGERRCGMNLSAFPLLAAESVRRTTFEWGRIQSNTDWILPIAVCLLVLLYVRGMYRRDAAELRPAVRWFLTGLRSLVFLGLLALWLQPQWRTEEERTIPSRAVLLVDTSMSMGLTDLEDTGSAVSSRIEQVAAALEQSDFVRRLRLVHDVTVYPFDEELRRQRAITLPKLLPEPVPTDVTGGGAASGEARADQADPESDENAEKPIDWKNVLTLAGQETRLGQALRDVMNDEAGKPLSGVVLLSDGGQNAGVGPEPAVELAREAQAPIIAVGVGSDRQPPSVRVAGLKVPPRVYPGDPYSVSGVVQAWRMAGQVVTVQLLAREADGGAQAERGTGAVIDSTQVTLGADGEQVPVGFEVVGDRLGRRTLVLRVLAPPADRRRDDNFLEGDIEVIDQKTRVLLFAGGPTREYQFLSSQLYRDETITVDVMLQTAAPGISQNADEILDDFPATREEMYRYDCVIAFDPDWQELTSEQVDLLEGWVAEQGGGLIVVAGAVFTGNAIRGWVQAQDPAMNKVRALYPVEFQRRIAVLESRMYAAEEPWPLEFSREGLEADFLQPADSPLEGRRIWAEFEGVYSFFPVRGPKQGATVLARFSDPQTMQEEELPVYFAWHFYGSGRVFFMGSGEMWRLRALDDSYFEKLYTKLIRHTSQGRLLRGSTRGMLLVGQERYWIGNTVAVQAYRLTDARLTPLEDPSVNLQVIHPDQAVQTVTLKADPARAASYVGQLTVLKEGEYRIELPLGGGGEEERLTQRIRVEVPDLERENPLRNDALLSEVASKTGGKYVVGAAALAGPEATELLALLRDRTKTIILTDSPSPLWEEFWRRWVMYVLCGLLAFEWLIRRLLRLA
jgi:hypothetical protein